MKSVKQNGSLARGRRDCASRKVSVNLCPFRLVSITGMCLLLACAGTLTGCGSESVWKHQTFALAVSSETKPGPVATNTVALTRVTVSPLFQSHSFTYRTGEDSYEHDPYASFVTSPEHTLAESIRARLRNDGLFGHLIEPDSGLTPSLVVEASALEMDGDFRDSPHPLAEMEIHFMIYNADAESPHRILLDKVLAAQTPLAQRTATALVAGWDHDLGEIMDQLSAEYAKADPNGR
jgi:ABC-type uncharacterized transport system auxiliary subunit